MKQTKKKYNPTVRPTAFHPSVSFFERCYFRVFRRNPEIKRYNFSHLRRRVCYCN